MYRLRIEHVTDYEYTNSVRLGTHRLMIRPREGHDIRIESSILEITPKAKVKWFRDIYNNSVAVLRFATRTSHLRISSAVMIQNYETAPLDFLIEKKAVYFPFLFDPTEHIDLMSYQIPCFPGDHHVLADWCSQFWSTGQTMQTYVLLRTINRHIVNRFRYEIREEAGVQRPAETIQRGAGSCRDFATLFIEACRHFGLPARFVSGYLHNPAAAPQHNSTHAWSEVYLPGAGWKGFDNTSALVVGAHHIACAVNRHPAAIPPISGTFIADGITRSHMQVSVSVTAA